jgi:hypothetical protein
MLKDLAIQGVEHLRRGEDVMLGDVLSFDLRVYDPRAPITGLDKVAIVPGDPAYNTRTPTSPPVGRGEYVDLNYGSGNSLLSSFSGRPHLKSGLGGAAYTASCYCTWSTHYESDGLDQDGDGEDKSPVDPARLKRADGLDNDGDGLVDENIDEGVDGLDSDGNGIVDDAQERETSPPYPVPLRGLSVTLRMMEYNTRQVRQISVAADFLPE